LQLGNRQSLKAAYGPGDVTLTGVTAGARVTPTAGLTTTELCGTAQFTVVLGAQPSADVAIDLSSSNTAEGTVAPGRLVFTDTNWNVPQVVTVTGADDTVVDGDVSYTILTAPAISADLNFDGLTASDVTVTNVDNDTRDLQVANLSIEPATGLRSGTT